MEEGKEGEKKGSKGGTRNKSCVLHPPPQLLGRGGGGGGRKKGGSRPGLQWHAGRLIGVRREKEKRRRKRQE